MKDRVIALIAASVIMFILTFLLIFFDDGTGHVWTLFLLAGAGFAIAAVYFACQSTQTE
jgi:threonine/homoserine/homoserine lactone efflux protein